jgi:hypothetical protein
VIDEVVNVEQSCVVVVVCRPFCLQVHDADVSPSSSVQSIWYDMPDAGQFSCTPHDPAVVGRRVNLQATDASAGGAAPASSPPVMIGALASSNPLPELPPLDVPPLPPDGDVLVPLPPLLDVDPLDALGSTPIGMQHVAL